MSSQHTDILLVTMPFGPVTSPSLGLSLLEAGLRRRGIDTQIAYFTLAFAERIGWDAYDGIAMTSPEHLVGEWIFAPFAFGPRDEERYTERVLRASPTDFSAYGAKMLAGVERARAVVEDFLEECLDAIGAASPRIVGFTSVFQQHVASLALAQRIKQRFPQMLVIFGGANCESVMGRALARSFPYLDAVVSGEADLVFPEIAEHALRSGAFPQGVEGVYTAHDAPDAPPTVARPIEQLDALALPRYDEFFEHYAGMHFAHEHPPRVLMEMSRGCWWGAKNHCTFCGLNGSSIGFRSKSAARALEEFDAIVAAHPGCNVGVTDNILSMKFFADLLPALAERKNTVPLFFEIKANLRREQVRLLRDAGVTGVQPGVESLSTPILQLMRKGVTLLQNVQLLKWCKEFGVKPLWNILWGFPGEEPAEYERMAAILPVIEHLPPPAGSGSIRLDRFSPNYERAEEFGFVDVAPAPAYACVYPLDDATLHDLAYYFAYRYREPRNVAAYTAPLVAAIAGWNDRHDACELVSLELAGRRLICDARDVAGSARLHVLDGHARWLYEACDGVRSTAELTASLNAACGAGWTEQRVEDTLATFVRDRLMLQEGNKYLALAIPIGDYHPRRDVMRTFMAEIRALRAQAPAGAVA
jgi:ribosomal peptide maturation radical SAM protein 1